MVGWLRSSKKVSKQMFCLQTENWKYPSSLELLCLSIQIKFNKSFILCTIYRTAHDNNDLTNIGKLLDYLQSLGKNVILVGDFNFNLFNDKNSSKLSKLLSRYKFVQQKVNATRENSLLDLVICNHECVNQLSEIKVQDENISDHFLVNFRYKFTGNRKKKSSSINIQDYTAINWEKLILEISICCRQKNSNLRKQ